MWRVVFSKQAAKDAKKLSSSGLKPKAQALINLLEEDPFAAPPRYERLVGDLSGMCSRRINIQHRLVYEVFEEERTVRVLRMWTHYGGARARRRAVGVFPPRSGQDGRPGPVGQGQGGGAALAGGQGGGQGIGRRVMRRSHPLGGRAARTVPCEPDRT